MINYKITLANGEEHTLTLTLSQPAYYAQEYAQKWAKERFTMVSSVVKE